MPQSYVNLQLLMLREIIGYFFVDRLPMGVVVVHLIGDLSGSFEQVAIVEVPVDFEPAASQWPPLFPLRPSWYPCFAPYQLIA